MYSFPHLPDTSSTGRQLLLDIADQSWAEYDGEDAARRAAFADGGSAHELLRRRHDDAPWYSPMPPPEAIARLEQNHTAIRLLRRLVGAGPLAVHDDWFVDFSQANVNDLEHSNANDKEYVLYLRRVTFQSGQDLGRVMDGLAGERPIDVAYHKLVQNAGLVAHHGPVTLSYVGCTVAATTYARQQQVDKTRVATLIQVAQQLDTDIIYQAFELDRIAFDGKRVAGDVEHIETVARLLLGPLALNSSPGGRNHIVTLSRETSACISKLRETAFRPAAELLAGKDGWDRALDERLKIEVAQAYATKMPEDFRRLMSSEVFKLAIAQSSEIQTWHGLVPSAILGKDIPAEAFADAIPFYSIDTPGRGPRLIAEAERVVLGNILPTSRGCRTFRGPFRNLWEVLVHVSWKLARIWLADWLKIARPMTVFAMGGQVVRALAEGLAIAGESPRTSRVPMFRLAGRPMVVAFGDGPCYTCLMIPCIDPGKAAYNALASPFEQELIVIAKAIHSLAVALVLQLWRGQVALGQFLTNTLLPRLLMDIEESGLGACRDRVVEALAQVYSTISLNRADLSFGQRSAALKATGGRRSMLAVGDPFSEERQQMLAGIMVIVNKHAARGATALLPDLLPRLSFGEIGDAAWQTFVLSSAGNKDLWEAAKSYGSHVTDDLSAAEKRAYAAKRFVRTPDAAATLAALRAHNDTCVHKIGAPGYAWSKANDRMFLYECDRCGESFLANAKGQGGNLAQHAHDGEECVPAMKRKRIVSLSEIESVLVSLAAANKLSPLADLTEEINGKVSGSPSTVPTLVVKNCKLSPEELEFLALYDTTRAAAVAAGEAVAVPAGKALDSVASAIASDSSLRWFSCTACGEQALRAANRKQQHKCLTPRPYMQPVADTPSISSFEQLPAAYRLALLAEAMVPGQLVEQTLRSARLDWRTVTSWKVGESRASLLPSPAPTPTKSKRARNNYTENYAKLDNIQAAQAEPLGDAQIRQELLAMGLTAAQAKTAKTGWVKRARRD
ncbi:hypothetical protein HDU88_008487 [Geranomyces variabilis]|nr:hypothetical protein HDU88_008487 [Geranomyces variabilis]